MRRDAEDQNENINNVSIHAPARGATGGRRISDWIVQFQSTHPRGVRRGARNWIWRVARFNPRTREGCDCDRRPRQYYQAQFQSTHPRGVRQVSAIRSVIPCRFQSTHPRGVRRRARSTRGGPVCFNPRTREGCDNLSSGVKLAKLCFNPRTREGCDVNDVILSSSYNLVSIHAPARGAT
ncbi:hypothetical protein S1OALGB6SA_16 [Olavius algarvensis spirochete endosymbiont]|nr:MAG: hypothetical protein [Olavius algarvensis spirochete endosymbiont]VDA98955.1 hypothetical protein S1OALGB6SA_16 [Olavius algarvensis spirochete endosymbiont]